MKIKCLLFLLLIFNLQLLGQQIIKDKYSSYSKVKIYAKSPEDLLKLQTNRIDIEHYQGRLGEFIEVVINQDAIERLPQTGLAYEIIIHDMDKYYAERPPVTEADLIKSKEILKENGITGFGYGSMGGFYTFAEVIQKLDSMRLLYPNLITQKDSLYVTEQGRPIWAVEISDNPGMYEPEEANVYFDGLHHAREPISMSVLMYYMYWLLENYGTNPEATYLVNNRRIFFIPVVNPDGYVYNQSTNPNGGGMWRKNRRNNGGSYGVDLNRNYGYRWGYDNIGSSGTPSAEDYRGPSPWSEPETRAVRDYVWAKMPSIGFTVHSVAGHYLNPYGYKDSTVTYDFYAEFANEFTRYNNYLYGTSNQMIGYVSNGTTRDWLHHDASCYGWTLEVGGSSFWPAKSEIIPLCQEIFYSLKYLTWVSGAYANYHSFKLLGRQFAAKNDTIQIAVAVRNKGITQSASGVNVTLQSLNPNATPIVNSVMYDPISPRQTVSNGIYPFMFAINSNASTLEELKFTVTVTQEGIVTSLDTISIIVGAPRLLFSDDAESGIGQWTRSGTGVLWDTTSVMTYNGQVSFADSRYGNAASSSTNYFATTNSINLTSAVNPRLEYFARWSFEKNYEYTRIQISTNNGSTWTNLSGRHTVSVSGQPSYTATKGTWAWEFMNLNSYIGQQIKLRFNLVVDASYPRGDGFYFDNIRVVDYRDTSLIPVPAVPSLVSPSHNSINQPVKLTLRWTSSPTAITYKLQVATDSNFISGIFLNDSTLTDTTKLLIGLGNNIKYFWRVCAKNVGGSSQYSEVWKFTTIPQIPSQVILLQPANNEILNKDSVLCLWNQSQPVIEYYWFELATDSLFNNPIVDSARIDTSKLLRNLVNNQSYWWRVRAYNTAGWGSYSDICKFSIIITDVKEADLIPKEYSLKQNYPNPFNPTTNIEFEIPKSGFVSLKVFNILGQEAETLIEKEMQPGKYSVKFDASKLPSGIYFYRLQSGNFSSIKKLILMR